MIPASTIPIGKEVLLAEAQALRSLAETLDEQFDAAVEALLHSSGGVIVSGLGKSGNIAQKIAATLTSTGTPAVFMHPVEALHGDLGIVTERHTLIALSRSGQTDEIVRFVSHFRRLGGPVIGLTQNRASKLAELSEHLILLPDVAEAGPLQLAPTTSCVLQLAAGDALAMALIARRGFRAEDFAQYHPEGPLGRRLLLRAADVMRGGESLPMVKADEPFERLMLVISQQQIGMAVLVEPSGDLLGVFTDGDLRRLIERTRDFSKLSAREAHARSRRSQDAPPVPISVVAPDALAVECLQIMRREQISSLVVAGADLRPVGVVRLIDLIQAGLG